MLCPGPLYEFKSTGWRSGELKTSQDNHAREQLKKRVLSADRVIVEEEHSQPFKLSRRKERAPEGTD
jgi:hypothetical protein